MKHGRSRTRPRTGCRSIIDNHQGTLVLLSFSSQLCSGRLIDLSTCSKDIARPISAAHYYHPYSPSHLPYATSPAMIKARSVLPLATIACVLLALSVSAAPTNDNPHSAHDTINDIWSAINLWLYRLLHGGKYPPGYQVGGGSGEPSPSSASISIPVSTAHHDCWGCFMIRTGQISCGRGQRHDNPPVACLPHSFHLVST